MRIKPNKTRIVETSEKLNGKRDMRKKVVKSKITELKSPIIKGQDGLKFATFTPLEEQQINITPINNPFSEYNFPTTTYQEPTGIIVPKMDVVSKEPVSSNYSIKNKKGLSEFNKVYDEVEKEYPEAKKYRKMLTKIADVESGFNSSIRNRAGAPAYGYFQFMDFNIKPLGISIEQFRNNQKLQIKAAIDKLNSNKKQFTADDFNKAKQLGFNENAMLGGAHLGGVGGVRRFIQGRGNASDKHWSKTGSGSSVKDYMKMFNF